VSRDPSTILEGLILSSERMTSHKGPLDGNKVTRVFRAYEICFQALEAYDRIISIRVSSAELSKVVW
jgi:hypothetical protein